MCRRTWFLLLSCLLVVLPFILLLSGCGDESAADTVERHLELLNERQWDEFYDMHAGPLPDRQEFIDSLEDSFPEGATIADIEIISEEEEGDEATVEVKYVIDLPGAGEQEVQQTVRLVKEGGSSWKIAEGI